MFDEFTEATNSPAQHPDECRGTLIATEDDDLGMALICWDCGRYWLTNTWETDLEDTEIYRRAVLFYEHPESRKERCDGCHATHRNLRYVDGRLLCQRCRGQTNEVSEQLPLFC